jgi:hypothetical protein
MTMDAGSRASFRRLIALGASSLLQYASESSPWSLGGSHDTLDKVRVLAAEDRAEIARFTRWLQKKHERVPLLYSYPSHFTTMNFVSLDYLLPKLLDENARQLVAIEGLLNAMDDEEARALTAGYLDMKKRHLETLRALCISKAPAVAP